MGRYREGIEEIICHFCHIKFKFTSTATKPENCPRCDQPFPQSDWTRREIEKPTMKEHVNFPGEVFAT